MSYSLPCCHGNRQTEGHFSNFRISVNVRFLIVENIILNNYRTKIEAMYSLHNNCGQFCNCLRKQCIVGEFTIFRIISINTVCFRINLRFSYIWSNDRWCTLVQSLDAFDQIALKFTSFFVVAMVTATLTFYRKVIRDFSRWY